MNLIFSLVIVAITAIAGCFTYICKRAFDFAEKCKK